MEQKTSNSTEKRVYLKEPSHMKLFGEFKAANYKMNQTAGVKKKYWTAKHMTLPAMSVDLKKDMAKKLGLPIPVEWKKKKTSKSVKSTIETNTTPTTKLKAESSLHKMSLQFILNDTPIETPNQLS